jgi:hypothetical protein
LVAALGAGIIVMGVMGVPVAEVGFQIALLGLEAKVIMEVRLRQMRAAEAEARVL